MGSLIFNYLNIDQQFAIYCLILIKYYLIVVLQAVELLLSLYLLILKNHDFNENATEIFCG